MIIFNRTLHLIGYARECNSPFFSCAKQEKIITFSLSLLSWLVVAFPRNEAYTSFGLRNYTQSCHRSSFSFDLLSFVGLFYCKFLLVSRMFECKFHIKTLNTKFMTFVLQMVVVFMAFMEFKKVLNFTHARSSSTHTIIFGMSQLWNFLSSKFHWIHFLSSKFVKLNKQMQMFRAFARCQHVSWCALLLIIEHVICVLLVLDW